MKFKLGSIVVWKDRVATVIDYERWKQLTSIKFASQAYGSDSVFLEFHDGQSGSQFASDLRPATFAEKIRFKLGLL